MNDCVVLFSENKYDDDDDAEMPSMASQHLGQEKNVNKMIVV